MGTRLSKWLLPSLCAAVLSPTQAWADLQPPDPADFPAATLQADAKAVVEAIHGCATRLDCLTAWDFYSEAGNKAAYGWMSSWCEHAIALRKRQATEQHYPDALRTVCDATHALVAKGILRELEKAQKSLSSSASAKSSADDQIADAAVKNTNSPGAAVRARADAQVGAMRAQGQIDDLLSAVRVQLSAVTVFDLVAFAPYVWRVTCGSWGVTLPLYSARYADRGMVASGPVQSGLGAGYYNATPRSWWNLGLGSCSPQFSSGMEYFAFSQGLDPGSVFQIGLAVGPTIAVWNHFQLGIAFGYDLIRVQNGGITNGLLPLRYPLKESFTWLLTFSLSQPATQKPDTPAAATGSGQGTPSSSPGVSGSAPTGAGATAPAPSAVSPTPPLPAVPAPAPAPPAGPASET